MKREHNKHGKTIKSRTLFHKFSHMTLFCLNDTLHVAVLIDSVKAGTMAKGIGCISYLLADSMHRRLTIPNSEIHQWD